MEPYLIYKCGLHSLPHNVDSIYCCQWNVYENYDNTKQYSHSIVFKKPFKCISNSATIQVHLNESQLCDYIYEIVDRPCVAPITQLDKKTSKQYLLLVGDRLVEYFFILHKKNTINKLLTMPNYARLFCENVPNITVDNDVAFLFRHRLETTKSFSQLKTQSYKLIDIIIFFFFGDQLKKKPSNHQQCTNNSGNCKFTKFQPIFTNFDYSIFHTICNHNLKKKDESKALMFENLIRYFHHDSDNVSDYIDLMKM